MCRLYSQYTHIPNKEGMCQLSKSIELENDIHLSHDLIFFEFSKSLSIRNEIRPSKCNDDFVRICRKHNRDCWSWTTTTTTTRTFFDKTLSRFKMQKIKVRLAPYPGGRERERERERECRPIGRNGTNKKTAIIAQWFIKAIETNTGRFLRCVNGA